MKDITIKANGLKKVKTINEQPTMTQQQHKDMVDINKIMARYKKTGQITHLRNAQQGVYADLTNIPDLAEAHMQVQKAQAMFEQIPAHIRHKFENKPENLISYLKDESNNEEAYKYGLKIRPPKKSEPTEPPAQS